MSSGAKYSILYVLISGIVVTFAGRLSAGVVFEIEMKDHTPMSSSPMGSVGPGGMGANRPDGIQVQANTSSPASASRIFKTQISAQGRDIKLATTDEKGQPNNIMIFHGQKQEMLVLNPKDQTYMVMDSNTIEAMAKRMNQMEMQMQEALKHVPEDQRAMVEKMMKQHIPNQSSQTTPEPPLDIKKMDEKDTKNGFPCVRYVAKRADKTIDEYWVTEWKNIQGGDEITKGFEDMAGFYQKMMDTFSKNSRMGGPLLANKGNPFEHIKDFKGVPVVTKTFSQDNTLATESTLRSAKQQTLAPDTFEPPAGYKQRDMLAAP